MCFSHFYKHMGLLWGEVADNLARLLRFWEKVDPCKRMKRSWKWKKVLATVILADFNLNSKICQISSSKITNMDILCKLDSGGYPVETCWYMPTETGHEKYWNHRIKWLNIEHGIMQNSQSTVYNKTTAQLKPTLRTKRNMAQAILCQYQIKSTGRWKHWPTLNSTLAQIKPCTSSRIHYTVPTVRAMSLMKSPSMLLNNNVNILQWPILS